MTPPRPRPPYETALRNWRAEWEFLLAVLDLMRARRLMLARCRELRSPSGVFGGRFALWAYRQSEKVEDALRDSHRWPVVFLDGPQDELTPLDG